MEDLEIKRKRLHFRAWHRGTRELDLIMGSFADRYIGDFTAGQLDQFEALLALSDPDVYNWITGVEDPPANLQNDIFELLKSHRLAKSS